MRYGGTANTLSLLAYNHRVKASPNEINIKRLTKFFRGENNFYPRFGV
jgi:hypothetical protein